MLLSIAPELLGAVTGGDAAARACKSGNVPAAVRRAMQQGAPASADPLYNCKQRMRTYLREGVPDLPWD
jgi:hypothetical protein